MNGLQNLLAAAIDQYAPKVLAVAVILLVAWWLL